MHIARAVECRSVIVFGGRMFPAQGGYMCNENLFSELPCSGCWKHNSCEFDIKCMAMISVENVVAAVGRQMEKHGAPLQIDRETNLQPDAYSRAELNGLMAERRRELAKIKKFGKVDPMTVKIG